MQDKNDRNAETYNFNWKQPAINTRTWIKGLGDTTPRGLWSYQVVQPTSKLQRKIQIKKKAYTLTDVITTLFSFRNSLHFVISIIHYQAARRHYSENTIMVTARYVSTLRTDRNPN